MRYLRSCQTPECGDGCAYAWSCHNLRIGRFSVSWGLVGLGVLAVFVALALWLR